MARTAIPIQVLQPNKAIADISFTAADAVNNHEVVNDGRTVLVFKNTDTAAKTVTIKSVPDIFGRSGDLVVNVPASTGLSLVNMLLPSIWNQRGAGDLGKVHIDVSAATGLSLAAIRLQ